jgi:CheY-like chemotaxis protein/HPt (histidine-containing phosphotransfer) domain-containing protein
MERLFKPFSQVDSSTTRSFGGTGLGLVISKNITELMGGKIGFFSKEGEGSRFYFSIKAESVTSDKKVYSFEASPLLIAKKILIIDHNKPNGIMLNNLARRWRMNSDLITDITNLKHKLNFSPETDLFVINASGLYDRLSMLIDMIRSTVVKKNLGIIILKPYGKDIYHQESEGNPFIKILSKPIKRKQFHQAILSFIDVGTRFSDIIQSKSASVDQVQKTEKIKVLLAEDNNVNQMVAIKMLERLGYRADIVSNGKEAIDANETIKYDLIFMDILMPEMDGLEACRRIKSNPDLEAPPVIIAMTANAMAGDQDNYLKAGMDDYISKPVNLDELKNMLNKWYDKIIKNKSDVMKQSIEKEIELDFIVENKISFLQDIKTEGDLEFFKEMLDIYIKEIPKNLGFIRDAIFQNNPDHLRFYVHKLKGSSLTLGIESVIGSLRILEDMALENQISDESLKEFKKISEQYDIILEEIVLLKNKYSNYKLV